MNIHPKAGMIFCGFLLLVLAILLVLQLTGCASADEWADHEVCTEYTVCVKYDDDGLAIDSYEKDGHTTCSAGYESLHLEDCR